MKLHRVTETSARVAETSARRAKIEALAALLAELRGAEVPAVAAWLTGELRQGRIGLGYALVRELDGVAAAGEPALDVLEVDRAFDALAAISGSGSKERRLAALRALLARATAVEQSFLRRLIVGELRQGALEGVLVEAVARASGAPAASVRRAAMLGGDLRAVTEAALREGEAALARFSLQLLRPVRPMLASSAADSGEIIAALGEAALEWKLDGARVQLHRRDDDVRVFTRNGNDVTRAVPELVELALALPERALVLDGETIALGAGGRPHPFQVTMRRFGRRLDVERLRAELPLSTFFFDVLHAGGEDLLDRHGAERWRALEELVPPEQRVPRALARDAEAVEDFLAEALARGHEGLLAKALDAPYEAGRRGARWLKLKPAHTLDLVVLAAEWGSGRRRGTLSNLHLGARGEAGFVMVGKTFKGLTDELLAWQTAELLARETHRDAFAVFVRPELVVEIALDGVQDSPHYPGGVALRFARVKRYRPDKTALEADTIESVRALRAR